MSTAVLQSDWTVVNRLRVAGNGGEPGRVAAAVASADLRPPGFPRAAVLCVRRLTAPRPRIGRAGMSAAPDWEEAVRGELDRLSRLASRPALGPIPDSAQAVLFADRTELLACLARDWLDGSAARRWWWRGLFWNLESARAFARIWSAEPEHVPAALHTLSSWGLARAAVALFAPREIPALLRSLADTFAANPVRAALAEVLGETGWSAEPRLEEGRESEPHATPGARATVAAPDAPWRGIVPECLGAGLSPEHECLLAVGLLLHRDPKRVRAPAFARELRRWRLGPSERTAARPLPAPPIDVQPPAPEELRVAAADVRCEPGSKAEWQAVRGEDTTGSPDRRAAGMAGATAAPPPMSNDAIPGQPGTAPKPPVSEPAVRAHPIRTQFGGAFYLINLGLHLGLYADFTRPAWPGLGLPIWDFVELVTRGLLGDRFAPDPLWALLAELSGRDPGTPPGEGLEPPPCWPVPADWVCPPASEPGASARWSAWLVPRSRERLCAAFGIEKAEDLPGLMLARAARVEVTPARLDVTLRLDELAIEVRLSGLDRDPGWVPAAGRVVAFHYD